MKIEIEFGEVEILRDTIFKQKEEIKQLKEQLSLLDEKSLQDKAISLSFHLFETYIAAVFQRLGLEPMHGESVRIPDSLNHYLGADWWRRGRLEITLGANITSRFKKAFLNLGIIFKEDMPNEVNFENDPPKVVSVIYEPKEETLEEASLRLYPINSSGTWDFNKQYRDEWIEGANWQAQRMYSEEDLRKAYLSAIKTTGDGWNGEYADGNDPNIEEKFSEGFTQWFNQFKKKQSGE
jgi:hypothetical protein